MSKITNINILRDKMLKAFEDFESGKIDAATLSTLSKANDSIINGLTSEMRYAILTNQKPNIPFFGEQSGIPLETTNIKKLL